MKNFFKAQASNLADQAPKNHVAATWCMNNSSIEIRRYPLLGHVLVSPCSLHLGDLMTAFHPTNVPSSPFLVESARVEA